MFMVRQDYTEEELDEAFDKIEEAWEISRFELEERKNKEAFIKSRKILNANDNIVTVKGIDNKAA